MIPKSLTFRTIAAGTVWIAFALGLGGWIIFNIFSESASRQFDARLEGHLDLLTAALAASSESPASRMGAPDFGRIFSGLYWQAMSSDGTVYTSRSLWDTELVFDLAGRTEARMIANGPDDQPLRLIAREMEGADSKTWTLAVAADRTSLSRETDLFQRALLISSIVLAITLLAAAIIMLRTALAPLKTLREAVLARHHNEGEKIGGAFPREVQPLVDDLNTLLERNERLREKGRVQAANLAHALKTPAAILRNEVDRAKRGLEVNISLAESAVENVSAAADRHLNLSTAGPEDTLSSGTTDLVAVAEETIRALKRLFAEKSFHLTAPKKLLIPLSRAEQMEILGNLIENAGKWSMSEVSITLEKKPGGALIVVEDDGEGVPWDSRKRILTQGVRLDETRSGSGLGLTIVSDIIERHEGRLALESSDLGGLKVRVELTSAHRA